MIKYMRCAAVGIVMPLLFVFLSGCEPSSDAKLKLVNGDHGWARPVICTTDPPGNGPTGEFPIDYGAEFTIAYPSADDVYITGYDPIEPVIWDDITVSVVVGQTRVVEWDGFEWWDRGLETAWLADLARALGLDFFDEIPAPAPGKPRTDSKAAVTEE